MIELFTANNITSIFTAVGACGAGAGLFINIKLSKNRATIDLVLSEMEDIVLQEAIKQVNKLSKDQDVPLSTYLSYKSDDNNREKNHKVNCNHNDSIVCEIKQAEENKPEAYRTNRRAILKVLNSREFVAVGIHNRAFSEQIYKQTNCTNFIKDWNNLSGVISEIRRESGKDTLFQDFERLAKKWKKKPLKSY